MRDDEDGESAGLDGLRNMTCKKAGIEGILAKANLLKN